MSSTTHHIQTESLSHLEYFEMKKRKTERLRTKAQCNKAYNFIAQLEQNNADFVPAMTDYISRLTEEDTWKDVKTNAGHLANALQEFKDKHKADEYCIRKVESALRNAEKNMGNSVRRSERIKEIRAAQKALD